MTKIKKAFTLAEVLITLGIIGILAALTIPNLIASYQKQQYTTQLKKVYAQFNQVLSQLAEENGCVGDLKCSGLFDSSVDLNKMIYNKFKVAKVCDDSFKGCMSSAVNTNYDGSGSIVSYDDRAGFISADGVSYSLLTYGDSCGHVAWGNGKTGQMDQVCGCVRIDINGPNKKPNYIGRDIFEFWITNGKGPLLYPYGGLDDNYFGWWKAPVRCSSTNKDGTGCAARIMENGWQMDY